MIRAGTQGSSCFSIQISINRKINSVVLSYQIKLLWPSYYVTCVKYNQKQNIPEESLIKYAQLTKEIACMGYQQVLHNSLYLSYLQNLCLSILKPIPRARKCAIHSHWSHIHGRGPVAEILL